MSPEQATGDGELAPTTDVYSLGCVLYEMLVGEAPFEGASASSIVGKILTEAPRRPADARPSIPRHVEAAVLTALEKIPADRFGTAAAFVAGLENPSLVHPAQHGARADRAETSGRGWLAQSQSRAALGAVGVLTVALAGLLLRRSEEPAPTDAPVVRVAFAESWEGPVLSDDGAWLATRPGFEGPILVRRLDDERTVSIPLEGEGVPLDFSPDGRSLLYSTETGLYRVSVDGGTPVEVAEAFVGGGADWGDDGRIVFFGSDGLESVPAEGGQPERLLVGGYLTAASPRLLPGGRHVLFTRYGAGVPSGSELRALNLETGVVELLLEDAVDATFLPTDVLLFGRPGRGLYGVAFDAERAVITGSPVMVVDSVAAVEGLAAYTASRDGTLLALVGPQPTLPTTASLALVDPEGGFESLPLGVRVPSWQHISPDGSRIAYLGTDGRGAVYDRSSGRSTEVTSSEFVVMAWHPSGDTLAVADLSGEGLRAVPVDGGPSRTLFDAGRYIPLGWIDGGRTLLYQRSVAGATNFDLMRVTIDPEPVASPYLDADWMEALGAFSPDGRWVAYFSGEDGDGDLQLRSFPDPSVRHDVAGGGMPEGSTPPHPPRWARDGGDVYWLGPGGVMAAAFDPTAPDPVGAPRLYLPGSFQSFDVDVDGRLLVAIAHGMEVEGSPDDGAAPAAARRRTVLFLNWRERIREAVHGGG